VAREQQIIDYRRIAEAMPQIIWIGKADGSGIEYVNSRWRDYTGLEAPRAMGIGWREIAHPDDLDAVIARRRVTIETGEVFEQEMRLRRWDGRYRWFLSRAVPVRDENGRIDSWIGTCTDIEEQKRAETLLGFLARVSRTLGESLDPDVLAHAMARMVVPDYADYCQIFGLENGELRPLAIVHRDPARTVALQEIAARWPVKFDDPGIQGLFAIGEAVVTADVTPEMLALTARDADHAALLQRIGARSTIVMPLLARGAPRGVLSAVFDASSDRHYTPSDIAMAGELARRFATALDNAHRYQHEHHVANALQEAMLPSDLPSMPGARLRSVYVAGESELQVGGDWYDAFVLPNGGIGLSIGDVTGYGLDAAVVMGEIRQAIRSAAIEEQTPEQVLEHADRALRSQRPEAIATAGFAAYDPSARTLHYAHAGHLPPVLCRADGSVEELVAEGLPLGMHHMSAPTSLTVALAPGTLVVFYTDGLIEFNRDAEAGERALVDALRVECRERSDNPALAIYRRVVPLDAAHSDDTAVLTLYVE
jgi:PAS domain S-box-containing protein